MKRRPGLSVRTRPNSRPGRPTSRPHFVAFWKTSSDDSALKREWAMSKFSEADIVNLYKSEAQKHGAEGTSTIQDLRTRHMEMDAILGYIRDGMRVLEIGCGNGFVA